MKVLIRSFLLLFFSMLLIACWGGNDSSPSDPERKLVRIDIVPSPLLISGKTTLTLAKGLTQPFIATGHFSDGTARDLTTAVAWELADPKVAMIDNSGLLTAIDVGTTDVTAKFEAVTSNSVAVTVSAATMTSLQITATDVTIAKGQTSSFTATGTYSDNSTADVTNRVDWLVSDVSIATITTSGQLTGMDVGTTDVAASLDGITSDSIMVTVSAAIITGIEVNPPNVAIAKGQISQLTATATYSDSSTGDVTNSVDWLVGDVSIATVTPSGQLTGMDVGTTDVAASLDGITSNNIMVTVSTAIITRIEVNPPNVAIAKGQLSQLTATATYSDSSTDDVTNSVDWLVGDVSIAAVTPSGQLTGVNVGTTNVTASLGRITSNDVMINVSAAIITDIQVTPPIATIAKGQSNIYLVATATYSDASTALVTNQVAWLVDDTSIATVTSSGQLTGIGVGETAVTASLDSVSSAPVDITVNPWLSVSGVGVFSVPGNAKYIWDDANTICADLSLGSEQWRLPNKDELLALYAAYPNGIINGQYNWPVINEAYASSTTLMQNTHIAVYLGNGVVSGNRPDAYVNYVTCIMQ